MDIFRESVTIHQKPVILMKQAIVLVNVEIGGFNGTDPIEMYCNKRSTDLPRLRLKLHLTTWKLTKYTISQTLLNKLAESPCMLISINQHHLSR
jgi:hypothetical protein